MTGQQFLLICGVLAAVVYVGADLTAASLFYPGYDYTAQQISELSAIGAPSRAFWLSMGYPYALLTIAFAAGVWRAGAGETRLRFAALLILLSAINGLVWVLVAPMHMRATEFTASDTMHIAFTIFAVLLILLFIGFGAAALGRGFRIYSAVTVVAMLAAGAIVGTQIPAIAAGEPTPWMGLVERVGVYSSIVWTAVFAIAVLGRDGARTSSLGASAGIRPA